MNEILPGLSPRRSPRVEAETGPVPVTLMVAAVTVAAQVVVEIGYVASRSGLTVVARVLLLALVGAQLLLVWRVLHLSPGAALGLFVTELATVLGAVANAEMGAGLRVALLAGAAVATVALAASLRAFPTPVLPGTDDNRSQ